VRADLTIIINEYKHYELLEELKLARSKINEIEGTGTSFDPNTIHFVDDFMKWKNIDTNITNIEYKDSQDKYQLKTILSKFISSTSNLDYSKDRLRTTPGLANMLSSDNLNIVRSLNLESKEDL
jgi:hypothetical protein